MYLCEKRQCKLRGLIDGKRVALPSGEWDGRVVAGGVHEFVGVPMTRDTFRKLSQAKAVELQVESIDFAVTTEVLAAWKSLALWLSPGTAQAEQQRLQREQDHKGMPIRVGMMADEVIKILGEPSTREAGWYNDVKGESWEYEQCTLVIADSDQTVRSVKWH
jgi:hypothetical protein